MKRFHKLKIALFAIVSTIQMSPAQATTSITLPEALATATADTVNSVKTVDGYLKWISYRVPENEIKALKNDLAKEGISLTQKFPKMSHRGNKVSFDDHNFIVYGAAQINVNGQVIFQSEKPFNEVVADIKSRLQPRNSAMNWLLPEAHADTSWLTSLLSIIAGGAAGYFSAQNFNGGYYGPANIGTNYLNYSTGSFYGSSGQVFCQNGQYYMRNGNGSYLGSAGAVQAVPPAVAAQMYGGTLPPCTYNNALALNTNFQTLGNTNYLGQPTTANQLIPPRGAQLIQ